MSGWIFLRGEWEAKSAVNDADGSRFVYTITICDDGSFWVSWANGSAATRYGDLDSAKGLCNRIEDERVAEKRQAETARAVNAVAVAGDAIATDDVGSMLEGERFDGLS